MWEAATEVVRRGMPSHEAKIRLGEWRTRNNRAEEAIRAGQELRLYLFNAGNTRLSGHGELRQNMGE